MVVLCIFSFGIFSFILGEVWGAYTIEEKIFSCTAKHDEEKIGNPLPVLIAFGFSISILSMILSNVYVQYKTRICGNAIKKYLGEHQQTLSMGQKYAPRRLQT